MIFVTVGTHEQPFNRLIAAVDQFKSKGIVRDDVFIQTGYSTYKPKYCNYKTFISYDDMQDLVKRARIVITHGGPASFLLPLQFGKIPIVVPRQKEFNEHVNDHQFEFSKMVAERLKNIIVVDNVEDLANTILNYDKLITSLKNDLATNNESFCHNFQNVVFSLFKS